MGKATPGSGPEPQAMSLVPPGPERTTGCRAALSAKRLPVTYRRAVLSAEYQGRLRAVSLHPLKQRRVPTSQYSRPPQAAIGLDTLKDDRQRSPHQFVVNTVRLADHRQAGVDPIRIDATELASAGGDFILTPRPQGVPRGSETT
jgi:hypothetical protein